MSGQVEVLVNGERHGDALWLADGDEVLFSMPGLLLSGKARILEWKLKRTQESLRGHARRENELHKIIREMAEAKTLDEARGIAWRAGALTEDPW